MALTGKKISLLVVLVILLCGGAFAQSDCTNAIISMSPCLDYITGNSTTPSSSCCSQLSTVVRSQPECLCQVLSGGGSSLGLNINQTQALALPTACNVQTPPVSQCNAASPTGNADSPTSTESGNGNRNGGVDSSEGSSISLSFSLLFVIVLVATHAPSMGGFCAFLS